jgi:hypothetical protein
MEKALAVIDELEKCGILKRYAIGGGIAATYYIEPILTYDLDIFFIPARETLVLAPIYDHAKKKGYQAQNEMILIEGIPVQFIPAYNELVHEAVENAAETRYKDIKTRVVRPEHLIAIALQTGRAKDRERTIRLLDEAAIDRSLLKDILKRNGLSDKFSEFEVCFYGKKSR